MTARWVVEHVAADRDLTITWEPISLLFKNDPDPDSEWHGPSVVGHSLLRVMESVRATDSNAGVQRAYWAFATRIHHDGMRKGFDIEEALRTIDLDPSHAAAHDDVRWDSEIRRRMDRGLELAGEDIGTPIMGFDDLDGEPTGIFGPVITRVPPKEQSLRLWDGMMAVATVPGFWELKRTRTEPPDFGERPRRC